MRDVINASSIPTIDWLSLSHRTPLPPPPCIHIPGPLSQHDQAVSFSAFSSLVLSTYQSRPGRTLSHTEA